MGLLTSLFFGFAPMLAFAGLVYWMDQFEKEPKLLLGAVFTWGVIVAAGGAFILNTMFGVSIYLLTGSEGASNIGTAVLSAPFIEESLKGLAVLLVFFLFRKEFDSILDGIIYAAITALGFAATENFLYIYEKGFLADGWSGLWFLVFIRVVVVGWQHPFYTALTGIGLSISRNTTSPILKWIAPVGGWFLAVSAHTLHNLIASLGVPVLCIAGSILDWSGWLIMLGFVIFMVFRERKWVSNYLAEEVKLGVISENQYHSARSITRRFILPIKAAFSGRFLKSMRFYQVCGEITHKKRQLITHGDESGNTRVIGNLREELRRLSSQVIT